MPISRAISLSAGARPSFCSSLCTAASMLRCWRRLPRLIQSPPRSSSSIAPRMRCVAKVSNCTPWLASKRVSASARPIMPTWIRSSSSMLAGSLAIIWCARRRTSVLYCFSSASFSSRPLAVYMGFSAPGVSVQGWRGGRGSHVGQQCAVRHAAQRRCRGLVGIERRIYRRPVALRGAEEQFGAARHLRGDAFSARGNGCGAEQQVVRHEPGAHRQQLDGGIGVGHRGRVVAGQHDRAHCAAREQAPQVCSGRRG